MDMYEVDPAHTHDENPFQSISNKHVRRFLPFATTSLLAMLQRPEIARSCHDWIDGKTVSSHPGFF
jgi:hypothetical protein